MAEALSESLAEMLDKGIEITVTDLKNQSETEVFPSDRLVESVLVQHASSSIQSCERLWLKIKNEKKHKTVMDDVSEALHKMRKVKSELEGTTVSFSNLEITEDYLQQIRQIIFMHVPESLNVKVNMEVANLVHQAFEGRCKKVIYIGLVSCTWYYWTQTERGQKANKNGLIVIYMNELEKVFAPVNPHDKEYSDVFDKGWFYAAEVGHLGQFLCKGKARFVEIFFTKGSTIFQSEEMDMLYDSICKENLLRSRGFLEQCRGQAVGAIGKKGRSGKLRLKDGATLYEFCQSFHLLHCAQKVLDSGTLPDTSSNNPDQSITDISHEALSKLQAMYQETSTVGKEDLFEVVLKWKSDIDRKMSALSKQYYTPVSEIERGIGSWLLRIRKQDHTLNIPLVQSKEDQSQLKSIVENIGGSIAEMNNIILIARAGSYLYNLSTPQSDIDYIIIYAHSTEELLSSCHRPKESIEDRGPEKKLEYGAYEVRLLCEMLMKGSVVVTELIFAEEVDYASENWKVLVENRQMFVTENLIKQYFGLIKNNMRMIEQKRHKDSPRERKLFYQVFHKISGIECMLEGRPPTVKTTGDLRDFILKIRRGPLEGDISRDNLYKKAAEKLHFLKEALANRIQRLPEEVHYGILEKWLISTRGVF